MRKQIHSSPREFSPGEKIYYKRPDSQRWKGPGTVIGQDGPAVFVRHGGTLVRVHKCRLQSAPLLDSSTDELKDKHATLDRKEDDENELKKDSTIEQDDSETEPSMIMMGRKMMVQKVRWKSRTILIEEILSSNKTLQSNQGVESAIQTKIVMIKFKLRCLAMQEKHLVAKGTGTISRSVTLHNWKGEKFLWI